ncbi:MULTISPECIES: hypothetical protein [unclassified Bdellovibrio]|uniref:hypothetical protein n=1 Tax=unclassified Bdellovibrio TaxID=2633795 RepID=UPI00115897BA|nr:MULTISPECIES: hypothetical protein [unclassified Bdellovibrio]QDK46501.1 hypothetical protein DOM22_15670 [Bdellovibrio sp. ZAP7]QLY24685.1 hypothetical protein HW988_14670 [Bdellovibrio sp. KM01]
MEKFLNSLPKPVLVLGALIIGIAVVIGFQPPHTVCDTEEEALHDVLKGKLFATQVKKITTPPSILREKEACQLGNSAGSCYEYFSTLKAIADAVSKSSSKCAKQLYDVKEVTVALNNGIELMARLAWGVKPPEPGSMERFGWLTDAEIATFCRLKSTFIRANGEEAWTELRNAVSAKLPGEEVPQTPEGTIATVTPRKASAVLTEVDIWNRSLFSVRCEVF